MNIMKFGKLYDLVSMGVISVQTVIYTEYPIKTIINYLCDIGVI